MSQSSKSDSGNTKERTKSLDSSRSTTREQMSLRNSNEFHHERSIMDDLPIEIDYETSLATANRIAADLIELKRLVNSPERLMKSMSNFASKTNSIATSVAHSVAHSQHISQIKAFSDAEENLRGEFKKIDTNSLIQDKPNTTLFSRIEEEILRSNEPIVINESDEIEVLGQRGIWANKAEVVNWRGPMPICEYLINEDANPEVITKRSNQRIEYVQELAIRYLRPPTPPAPGEIVIKQEANVLTPPAPPLVIRQQPPRPVTPEPLIIREAPPPAPLPVGRKLITISGKRIPPPPRKVVIERLAALPSKPQSVLIERWLPYAEVKRRVLFQAAPPDPVVCKPRNVIVQWEAPEVLVRKEFKDLGVIRANPAEYVQRYGSCLKTAQELPSFVLEIKPASGLVLAADHVPNPVHELVGDLHALSLIDLDREGLGEYKFLVNNSNNQAQSNDLYSSQAASQAPVSHYVQEDNNHSSYLSTSVEYSLSNDVSSAYHDWANTN